MPMLRREFLRTTGRLTAMAGLLPLQTASAPRSAGVAEGSLLRWERVRRDAESRARELLGRYPLYPSIDL